MPLATTETLKVLIGADLPDALLTRALASAQRRVIADGVKVDHEAFAELQEYYAASILETGGHIQGLLVSKTVADVSETYAQPQGETGGWLALYRRELINITGRKIIIV